MLLAHRHCRYIFVTLLLRMLKETFNNESYFINVQGETISSSNATCIESHPVGLEWVNVMTCLLMLHFEATFPKQYSE